MTLISGCSTKKEKLIHKIEEPPNQIQRKEEEVKKLEKIEEFFSLIKAHTPENKKAVLKSEGEEADKLKNLILKEKDNFITLDEIGISGTSDEEIIKQLDARSFSSFISLKEIEKKNILIHITDLQTLYSEEHKLSIGIKEKEDIEKVILGTPFSIKNFFVLNLNEILIFDGSSISVIKTSTGEKNIVSKISSSDGFFTKIDETLIFCGFNPIKWGIILRNNGEINFLETKEFPLPERMRKMINVGISEEGSLAFYDRRGDILFTFKRFIKKTIFDTTFLIFIDRDGFIGYMRGDIFETKYLPKNLKFKEITPIQNKIIALSEDNKLFSLSLTQYYNFDIKEIPINKNIESISSLNGTLFFLAYENNKFFLYEADLRREQ